MKNVNFTTGNNRTTTQLARNKDDADKDLESKKYFCSSSMPEFKFKFNRCLQMKTDSNKIRAPD